MIQMHPPVVFEVLFNFIYISFHDTFSRISLVIYNHYTSRATLNSTL